MKGDAEDDALGLKERFSSIELVADSLEKKFETKECEAIGLGFCTCQSCWD